MAGRGTTWRAPPEQVVVIVDVHGPLCRRRLARHAVRTWELLDAGRDIFRSTIRPAGAVVPGVRVEPPIEVARGVERREERTAVVDLSVHRCARGDDQQDRR